MTLEQEARACVLQSGTAIEASRLLYIDAEKFGRLLARLGRNDEADRAQRIADFRAGAKWYAAEAATMAPDTSTELGRLSADLERATGIREVPMGPSDNVIARELGLLPKIELRPEGVTAAAGVLAQQAIDGEVRREVRRRFCERIFLYRLAKWVHEGMSPIDAFSPMHNSATDLFCCGEPWQHPDYEIKP